MILVKKQKKKMKINIKMVNNHHLFFININKQTISNTKNVPIVYVELKDKKKGLKLNQSFFHYNNCLTATTK